MAMPRTNGDPQPAPAIVTDEEFARFCEFIYRRTGLSYGEAKRYFIDRRILDRVERTGVSSVQSYLALLRFDTTGRELEEIINSLTVNETYFWREEYQFACLANSILPEVVRTKRRGEPVRIWSLPCSTGEEPYSIAMWLLENWTDVDRYDVEIIASDIDTQALTAAQRGLYDARSVQRLPKWVLDRYFERPTDDRWRIVESLRGSIDFTHVNAFDRAQMAAMENIDVIFCRNMLIYFDDVSRREVADSMYSSLRPGGFVCLGHSESMSRISPLFAVRRFADAIVYQRPAR